MTWIVHLVVCFVVLNSSCDILCDGARLEEYLQEKQAYLQEVDRLFYTLYFHNASYQFASGTSTHIQHQSIRSPPLPSPDWTAHSTTFDNVTEEEEEEEEEGEDEETEQDFVDASHPTMFEEENFRPRTNTDGRAVRVEDLPYEGEVENVFSGDSGLFLRGQHDDDDDEGYEDSGSGDSTPEETTSWQTTSVLQQTSTSIPVAESNSAGYIQCGAHLKAEINSCVDLSLNARTILGEMSSHIVAESGYYNVTSIKYFLNLLRTCVSMITRPPSCDYDNDNDIVQEVTDGVIVFARRLNGGDQRDAEVDQRYFDCFHTHLQLLWSCLDASLPNVRFEKLVRIVIGRAKDVSVQECCDLNIVQQCVVGAMSKCEDATEVGLVQDMFDATKREMTPCAVNTTTSGNSAAVVTSLGSVVLTIVLSLLTLGFQKQLLN